MITTINIDDSLLEKAIEIYGPKTKTAIVEMGAS
ncbi:MAG: type II toxin-antitoxin system VapB family antitoxin [Bacteroidales bacterium]|jgi:Arc/MetJ family transcription regulator|nr:type II toxin-antitoxin system VapB family antitoxin [Bacteroidales bacterium]